MKTLGMISGGQDSIAGGDEKLKELFGSTGVIILILGRVFKVVAWASRPSNPASRRISFEVVHCWLSAQTKPVHVIQRFRAGRPKQQAGGLCHPADFENTP